MMFRARFTGQLVLASGPIKTARFVEKGQNLSLSAKTCERFSASVLAHVKAGKLIACDASSNAFVSGKPAPVAEPEADQSDE